MKGFLIFWAVGLVASEKLGLGYLPPPGAQFAGGSGNDIQVPFEPPNFIPSNLNTAPIIPQVQAIAELGNNRVSANIGPVNYNTVDVPVTTTAYAFSQTTTYPEGYETTALPINPVTGLPIDIHQPFQGQVLDQNFKNYNPNVIQTGPATNIQEAYHQAPEFQNQQFMNQPGIQHLAQYPGKNEIKFGSRGSITPINTYEGQHFGKQGLPNNRQFQSPSQNMVGTENVIGGPLIQGPGFNHITAQDNRHPIIQQQGVILTTAAPITTPITFQPTGEYVANQSKNQGYLSGTFPHGNYNGQPIHVEDIGSGNQLTNNFDTSINPQNNLPQQYSTGEKIIPSYDAVSEDLSKNIYKPDNIKSSAFNTYPTSDPIPNVPSSTMAYSPNNRIRFPERPQAAADRNAVILNYENVLSPQGYSYSYDTSNGIHADENAVVGNGTKAQGFYSYIGDDGKVYSVYYTADENGFVPHGDHLPTPPPIPEAIQNVIEQAARDKEAGIIDDGSYDEAKYGYKNYQGVYNRKPVKTGNLKSTSETNAYRKPIYGIRNAGKDYVINQKHEQNPSNKNTVGNKSNKPTITFIDNGGDKKGNKISSNEDKSITDNAHVHGSGDYTPETNKQGIEIDNKLNDLRLHGDNFGRSPIINTNVYLPENNNYENQPTTHNIPGQSHMSIDNSSSFPYEIESIDGRFTDSPTKQSKNQQYYGTIPAKTNTDINSYGQRIQNKPQNIDISYQGNTDQPIIGNSHLTSDFNQNRAHQQPPISNKKDNAGYYYQRPNNNFSESGFPTRFSPLQPSSVNKDNEDKEDSMESNYKSTRRPFVTPHIYDEDIKNIYKESDKNRGSSPRRPSITPDYEDTDDYGTIQKNENKDVKSMITPDKKYSTISYPQLEQEKQYVQEQSTSSSTPLLESTTPMSSYDSRGAIKTTSNNKQQPSVIPISTTTVSTSSSPQRDDSKTFDYKYETTGPTTENYRSRGTPGYKSSTVPSFKYGYSTPEVSISQENRKNIAGYPTTTTASSTPAYAIKLPTSLTSGISGTTSTAPVNYQIKYQYNPAKIGYTTTVSPKVAGTIITTPRIPLSHSASTGYKQSFQGVGSPTSFLIPDRLRLANGRKPSIGSNQYNYLNTPSTLTSTPRMISEFLSTNSPSSPINFGSSGPSYSTTVSPSTIASTPSFITNYSPIAPVQGYSTDILQTEDSFVNSPIDTFGRPSAVPSTHISGNVYNPEPAVTTGLTNPSTSRPEVLRPIHSDYEKSTAYPLTDQPIIVGEDFSGPKQPQRFDSKTGYHYK